MNGEAVDEKFIKDFINTSDGLPILLMNILDEFDENIELERSSLYRIHPEFEAMDRKEILLTSQLLKEGKYDEAEEFQIDYALDFLQRHPQFAKMVGGVESAGRNDLRIALSSIKEAFFGDIDYF